MSAKKSKKGALSTKKSFSGGQTLMFAVVFGLIGGIISYAAFAAPANGKKSSVGTSGASLSVSPIGSTDGMVHFGKTATFTLSTTAAQPWVSVSCYQNGQAVYGQYWGFWSGYSPSSVTSTMAENGVFTFGPPHTALWTSGAANCKAQMYTVNSSNYAQTILATTTFDVAP